MKRATQGDKTEKVGITLPMRGTGLYQTREDLMEI